MSEFLASNGIVIDDLGGASAVEWVQESDPDARRGLAFELNSNVDDALAEWYRHRRDRELGWWRDPEDPDLVCYPRGELSMHPGKTFRCVGVLNEREGVSYVMHEGNVKRRDVEETGARGAAARYFDAHPEKKPWEDAEPGEIWVLTGAGGLEQPWKRMDGYWATPVENRCAATCDAAHATAGRRIWPEGDSNE